VLRFLARHAIFILFPLIVVAIVFLGRIALRSAVSFGEWGARSVVESTLLLAKEKVERVEEVVLSTDRIFFQVVDPEDLPGSCDRWRAAVRLNRLVQAAAVIDDFGQVVQFFHRLDGDRQDGGFPRLFASEILPLIDKYDSLHQHKHMHQRIAGSYRLISALTVEFEGEHYTTVLVYDPREVVERLFETLLGDVGPDRMLNVVNPDGELVFGRALDGAGDFIVVRSFPSTFYKWRVQLAPLSSALYTERARTQVYTQALLIPLALAVVVFGLIVAYMAVVRERRLGRLKSEFVANVSHELKTPLSMIRMFSELLAMGRVTDREKTRRYHEIILRETERLTALIDRVLDFARIERGELAQQFEERDLVEVVDRAVEVYRHRIDERGVAFEYLPEPGLPPVRIDEHAITLAVINLIDNAVKYARGTDVIGIRIYRQGNMLLLDVYDHGAGIPEEHLKRIFERFYRYQAAALETHGQRGSGIGLSLVRHVAKAHGGSVVVTSTPGVETRFSIRLPVAEGR
jgi:two-component system phosphate regulon sensor histidine kinase PhoR